ncbi:Ubiquinol-cytochrome C reductase iron-sulfur subunit [Leptospirillum ferriphilum]|uniref:Ubiquinol-cytochrome C reductase iron-sulfur subunit n=3 Tax=Leptospirillum TaxID=179 RepID=A0A094WB60_9BACT|nr:Ubiquinol-cytochrome C reductase iron-sulfur subunit [Leptospirillum ferriphilum]
MTKGGFMRQEVIFRMGIPVQNASGQVIGTLEKLVFLETEKKITEIVVRDLSGLKRVPLAWVQEISEHVLVLNHPGHLEDLPVFDISQFEEVPTWFYPPGYRLELGSLLTLKPCDERFLGEEEALSRRDFMARSTVLVATLIGISLVVPIGGYVLAAAKTKLSDHWTTLTVRIDQLPMDEPVSHTFNAVSVSGWMRVPVVRTVWLIRHSGVTDPMSRSEDLVLGLDSPLEKKDSSPLLTVLSPICPHLGCSPQWFSDKKLFICPCHHSIYELNGKRIGGPAPRPMDQLPVRIHKSGEISILYEEFQVGTPQKIRLS